MTWFFRILLILIAIVLLLVGFIVIMRIINHYRFQSTGTDSTPAYYTNPADLSLYPTDIDGVTVKHITGIYLNGFHLRPDTKRYNGTIVTFGGSDGTPSYQIAELLAQAGYEVLALFYYGLPNQRPALTEVPLDFYQEAEEYIGEHISGPEPITVYGLSKGAELALNLVTRYDSIDHAVLIAPGSYNFLGLDYQDYQNIKSSWTWRGESLPYLNASQGDFSGFIQLMFNLATKGPLTFRPSYEQAVSQADNLEAARIKVENTKAKLLIIAGDDDLMWQSAKMAEEIQAARPENTEVIIYKEAGHLLFGDRVMNAGPVRLSMGGTSETNQAAEQASTARLLAKLAEWHGEINE